MNLASKLLILREMSLLMSEEGENQEYDRAIVESACVLLGMSADDRDSVKTFLHVLRGVEA